MLSNNYDKLNSIRQQIENMSKFNQIEILKILTKSKDVVINENKYGIHINLSEVSDNILSDIVKYLDYVNNQELFLSNVEKEKENYKKTYFVKDNKDIM